MPPRKNSKNAAAHKKRTQRRTKSQDAEDRGANKFVDLYDFAPIAYVSFDRTGRIAEANLSQTWICSCGTCFIAGHRSKERTPNCS